MRTCSSVLPAAVASLLSMGCGDGLITWDDEPLTLTRVSGFNQTDTVFSTLRDPLTVRVMRGPMPARGVAIRWWIDDYGDRTTFTNEKGIASVTWKFGMHAGTKRAAATVGEHTVEFTANARAGKPFALVPFSYYGLDYVTEQVGAVTRPLFFDYQVTVQDAHGNWMGDTFDVEWAVTAGGGAVEAMSSSDGYEGLFARHTLGPEPGLNAVVATVQGLPGQHEVTFNATAVDAAVAVLTDRFASDSIAVHVGQTVAWVWGTDYDPWYGYLPSEHDLVFEDTPAPPASRSSMRMGAHTRTFAQPGTYRYRCTLHSTGFVSGHVGIVTVTDPRQH